MHAVRLPARCGDAEKAEAHSDFGLSFCLREALEPHRQQRRLGRFDQFSG